LDGVCGYYYKSVKDLFDSQDIDERITVSKGKSMRATQVSIDFDRVVRKINGFISSQYIQNAEPRYQEQHLFT
jgi:hypothetical protein